MPNISLKAHFNGKTIQLDEPYELPPDAQLLVTVLSPSDSTESQWKELSTRSLSRAYGENEPEYSDADVKP